MRTASDLMGQPVLDTGEGKKIGKINGILVNPTTRLVEAFEVNTGLFHADQFIRWGDLRGIGPDAVTIPSEETLLRRKELDPDDALADHLQGRPVFTASGERLGEVADYRIDTGTAALLGLEVRPENAPHGLFKDSNSANYFVPIDQVETIGAESVVVREGVREALHQSAQESQPA